MTGLGRAVRSPREEEEAYLNAIVLYSGTFVCYHMSCHAIYYTYDSLYTYIHA